MGDHPQPEATGMTAERTNRPAGRYRIRIRTQVAIVIVLYVLSIGPMFWQWYEAENFGASPLIRIIYAPLRLACAIPLVENCVNRYINWWIA